MVSLALDQLDPINFVEELGSYVQILMSAAVVDYYLGGKF